VLQLLLTYAALQLDPGLVAATAATLLSMAVTAIAHALAAWWLAPTPTSTTTPDLGEIAGQARAFGVINLAVLLSTQSGVLLAGLLLGPAAAGLYRLADRVVHHLAVFLKQLSAVIGPEVAARAAAGETHQLRGLFVAGCRWTLLLGLPPFLVLVAWGDWLLASWVGPAGGAAGALAAALWGAMLLTLVQAQAVTLLVYGGEHARVARAFLLTATLDVAASVVLANWLGVWGLVLGTLCTVSLVDLFWFVPVGCRRAGLTPRRLLQAALAGSGPSLLALAGGLAAARAVWPEPTPGVGLALLASLGLAFGALWLATGLTAGERTQLGALGARLASRLRLSPLAGRDSHRESARLEASGR
jgi:O-antigen/teichoic acid export membrane protein